jgi:glycosyltransferase involved in cell wall biosynthesis
MDARKVSVIIPTFNRAFSLGRCIDSVLNQSYEDFEVIVVDDGSTDGSCDVAQTYLQDSRVRYIKHETNKGAQAARNTGIKSASGDFVAFLDSDDEWVGEKLKIQMGKLAESNKPSVVHSSAWVVDEETNEKRICRAGALQGYVYESLLASAGPLFPCMLAPKFVFEKIGYLDENVPSHQEWDTSIALSKYCEFVFCSEPLAVYYIHTKETISKDKLRKAQGFAYIVHKYENEIIRILGKNALSRHFTKIGALYYSAGNLKEARTYLSKAFVTNPFVFLRAMINLAFF